MASDQLVSSKLILETLLEQQRQGSERAMQDLEKLEPDLANYLLENFSLIHQKLLATGARPREILRMQHRIESLVLVCLGALRKAHQQLWQDSSEDKPDPPVQPPPT